jgi:hypothetical protein
VAASAPNPLAELLNRLLRDPAVEGAEVEVVFVHRGAQRDRRSVSGREVRRVGRRSLALADGTELPLHRVLEVRHAGAVVWRRAGSPRPDAKRPRGVDRRHRT